MPSTRESCVWVLKKETVIFKDPLNFLSHVYTAFLLGVLSFERIQRSGFHEGFRKGGPWYRRRLMWVVRNLEKIRERKNEGADRVEPYFGLYLYYASIFA